MDTASNVGTLGYRRRLPSGVGGGALLRLLSEDALGELVAVAVVVPGQGAEFLFNGEA